MCGANMLMIKRSVCLFTDLKKKKKHERHACDNL